MATVATATVAQLSDARDRMTEVLDLAADVRRQFPGRFSNVKTVVVELAPGVDVQVKLTRPRR